MPQFKQVSSKEIIARVIRNTGYKLPAMYHDDILEWIPEGIGILQVTRSLAKTSTGNPGKPGQLIVKNHVVPLPCGFISVLAVEDENGRRIPEGGDETDFTRPTTEYHRGLDPDEDSVRPTIFSVNPLQHQTQDGTPTTKPGSTVPIYGSDLERDTSAATSNKYYQISGNYIQTSFESGYIKLHYLTLPVCSEGYPLIPDNENVKQALYWYVLMMLIGAGYEHKVFSYRDAEERWNTFSATAISEVSYPSVDSMARAHRTNTRLIPPYRFYEDFFIGSEGSERISK